MQTKLHLPKPSSKESTPTSYRKVMSSLFAMESKNSSRTISLLRSTFSAGSPLKAISLSMPQKHLIFLMLSISLSVEKIEDLGPKVIEEITGIEKREDKEEREEIDKKEMIEDREETDKIEEREEREEIEKKEEIGEEKEKIDLLDLKEEDKKVLATIGVPEMTIGRTIREETVDEKLPEDNMIVISIEKTELRDREIIDLAGSTLKREKKTEEIESLLVGPELPTLCLQTTILILMPRYNNLNKDSFSSDSWRSKYQIPLCDRRLNWYC